MKKSQSNIEEKDNAILQKELNELLKDCPDEETRQHLQYLYDKNFDSFDSIECEIENNPELRKLADTENCIPFEDRVKSICGVTQKETSKQDSKSAKAKSLTRFMSIAASFILIFGITLIMRYLVFAPSNSSNTNYDYSDSEITLQIATEQEIETILQDFYSPRLGILNDAEYKTGKHNKSHEIVYILISGDFLSDGNDRKINLAIYLQEKYIVQDEGNYHTDNTVLIADKTISIYKTNDDSKNLYYCGFNVAAIRYYITLSTSIENDYLDFLNMFL